MKYKIIYFRVWLGYGYDIKHLTLDAITKNASYSEVCVLKGLRNNIDAILYSSFLDAYARLLSVTSRGTDLDEEMQFQDIKD